MLSTAAETRGYRRMEEMELEVYVAVQEVCCKGKSCRYFVTQDSDMESQSSREQTVMGVYDILKEGALPDDDPHDTGVRIEGVEVLSDLLFGLIHCLNLSNPPELTCTFEFLQKIFLNGQRLSSKRVWQGPLQNHSKIVSCPLSTGTFKSNFLPNSRSSLTNGGIMEMVRVFLSIFIQGIKNSSRVETLWERLQRDRALNHVCNQTNGRTKRHRRVTSLTRKHKSTCARTSMSKKSEKTKNVSKPGFRACVPPCSRYISSGDTHALCVACLGAEHAASALERADCPHCDALRRIATHCDALPMRLLRSRKDLFSAEGSFISVPRGSGPSSAEAERRLHSWGSQLDLVEGMETGDPLSSASPTRSAARPSGSEACAAVSSPRGSASTLAISSSEEVDVVSVDEAAAPQFPQYEELLEVVTRAVAKLSIDWPAEPLVETQKSKLDERFLRSRPPPARRSLPFFPDLHTEVSRSWNAPFSSRLFIPASYNYGYVAGLDERGYRAMPRVEQTLASYLSPESASSLKAPVLPSKPLRVTSALAYQADLLKELDEGEEMPSMPSSTDTRRRVSKRRRSSGSSLAVIRLAGLLRRSSPSRLPAPRTGKLRNRAWPLALLPIESECRRGPRPSGPDGSGPPGAAPSGGKRVAPQYSVSGSPPCPREIALPTLPVFQGAAVSSEHPPQFFPPSNVAGLGSSPPPAGSLGPLVQVLPAGQPFQDTVPAAPLTPEASLERLVPLVDHLAAWKLLPNVSAWVLHTVERGYRIQFGAPPPLFNGVSPTLVGPEQGLVMEQEVATLLRKEAIEVVPPHERESGFYSRYFIVPKKDGGLRPILDLRLLNRSVKRLKFKMLTIKQVVSQIGSEDWFVTIDLKDAYFHVSILPHHRKFLRFAFRCEAYQYRFLPFGLALSPRTFTKCVDAALAPLRLQGIRILNYIDDWLILAQSEMEAVRHRDVVLAHMKALGLRLNAKKSVLSPLQRTTYLGVVWDSTTMQARLSPARIESILTAVKKVKEGLSLTVKQFQQLLGLMAAASNVIPFGLLYMRPLQWWLKTKEFSPRGNPLRMIRVTRRCLRALDMWRKPWFLSQGPVLGAPCRRVTLATDASLTGWGAVMSGHPARGLWSGRQLTWHINCLEMLAVFRALKHFLPDLRDRHVLVRTDNTSVVSYINHQGGLRSRPLYKLAHQILVWSQDKLLSLRAVYVPGHLNLGADILSRQGPRPGNGCFTPRW
ncbi:Transposon Ty3-G Gag-Pol polyprotein [Labeo rohita]|uniref:ribonuclease H n=1 Tax=Labeo rohita TaxID=84645 RepID=A0ABQ8LMX4_LABRO|nr:Transposon Ty3-G Gag-Pol polyprotein [Labeo rohita]